MLLGKGVSVFLCHLEVVDVIVSCVLLGFSCDLEVLQLLLWFCIFLTECITVWPCCFEMVKRVKLLL